LTAGDLSFKTTAAAKVHSDIEKKTNPLSLDTTFSLPSLTHPQFWSEITFS
jgi:hypothetical protein